MQQKNESVLSSWTLHIEPQGGRSREANVIPTNVRSVKGQNSPSLESRKSPISRVGSRNSSTRCGWVIWSPVPWSFVICKPSKCPDERGSLPFTASQSFTGFRLSLCFSLGLLIHLCLWKNSPGTVHCRRMSGCPLLHVASRRGEAQAEV